MRWTLVVSMDRKVFVAIVDREVIEAASCPKRGKSGQGGKGQGKKGKSSKGEHDDGKGESKGGQVASTQSI